MYDDAFWTKRLKNTWSRALVRHQGKIKILPKHQSPWLWGTLSLLLKIVTLGFGPNLVENFYTTFNRTIHTPGDGTHYENASPEVQFETVRHELAHLDHMHFGRPDLHGEEYDGMPLEVSWLSVVLHALMYLFWILPFKVAYGRQEVEYWGYLQNVRVGVFNNKGSCPSYVRERVSYHFTSANYGWMATEVRAKELMDKMVKQAEREYADGTIEQCLFGEKLTQ